MDLNVASRAPLRLSLTFEPGDACFNGHFPGNPVVPGTLIAGLCAEAVREHLGHAGTVTIRRFSFARFTSPGAYDLTVTQEGTVFACTLSRAGEVFARGRIET